MAAWYSIFNCVIFTVMVMPRKMDRDEICRNPACFLSSTTSLDGNIEDFPHSDPSHLSVTAVLNYCKSKILNPYLRLLSVIGLRPLTSQQEPCTCLQFINCVYTIHVVLFLIVAYFLQYMACFRRDRGFCYDFVPNQTFLADDSRLETVMMEESRHSAERTYHRICQAPIFFTFIIPSILHLCGYLHAIFVIRHSDDDQLPVLMERVFLSSTTASNGLSGQKKLVGTLWLVVGFTGIWMFLSLFLVNFMMASGSIHFKWIHLSGFPLLSLKILLVVATLWQDLVQATIISNYCLQTQLLTNYLHFLKVKLLQYPIQPIEWIRHIENFKGMLNFINYQIAPSVCIFTFMNLSCGISGLLWFFDYDSVDKKTVPIVGISALNVILWVIISMAPFIQASRLSNACDILRSVGQEVRTRPFVHQDTPGFELDSILLYTASLKLKAKLFCIPITGKYLCVFFTIASICILVLGQCHYLNVS